MRAWDWGEGGSWRGRSVTFSVPAAEILSTVMVSDSSCFLSIMILYCLIRSSVPPRTRFCIHSTGEAKNVLTKFSRGSETENSCGMLLCTLNRHSYLSRITRTSHHMWNCLIALLSTDRWGRQMDRRLLTGDNWRMNLICARRWRQGSETIKAFPQAAVVLMMWRLPLRQPYWRQ